MSEYASRAQDEGLEYTVTAPLAYDATWTLALALNASINAVSLTPIYSVIHSCVCLMMSSGRYS